MKWYLSVDKQHAKCNGHIEHRAKIRMKKIVLNKRNNPMRSTAQCKLAIIYQSINNNSKVHLSPWIYTYWIY